MKLKLYVTYNRHRDGRILLGTVAHRDRNCPGRKFRGNPKLLRVIAVEGDLALTLGMEAMCRECS